MSSDILIPTLPALLEYVGPIPFFVVPNLKEAMQLRMCFMKELTNLVFPVISKNSYANQQSKKIDEKKLLVQSAATKNQIKTYNQLKFLSRFVRFLSSRIKIQKRF